MSREKKINEVREEFFNEIVGRCVEVIRDDKFSKADAVEKAVFHVLSTLEGSGNLPFFAILPQQDIEEQLWLAKEGIDYYPNAIISDESRNLSLLTGEDHHEFQQMLGHKLYGEQK